MDYRKNRNLLDVHTKASVIKFIYIAGFGPHILRHLEYIEEDEYCVRDLKAAGLDYAIVWPTGFSPLTLNSQGWHTRSVGT